MRKTFGIIIAVLAAILYFLGAVVMAKEVGFSFQGLVMTVSDTTLLGAFIGTAIGALSPGLVVHFFALKLLRPKKVDPKTKNA